MVLRSRRLDHRRQQAATARSPVARSSPLNTFTRLLARFAQGVVVVIIASSVAFLLSRMLPGDEFTALLSSPNISAERVEQLRAQFGDNTSWLHQYFVWLGSLLHGDLLWSKSQREPVTQAIARALPHTLQLMGLAFSTSIIGGILLGTWQATRQGSVAERIASGVTFTIFSLPDFWVAMLLQLIFAFSLGWLPFGGKTDFSQNLTVVELIQQQFRYTLLPWASLTLVDVAVFARYQRAAVRDVLGQQFLRTARAKGVPESDITWKHTLRVALLPMITITGMYFPALLVGAILIETVFSWPGVGQLLIKAVEGRDYFLVSSIVVIGSAMTALGSFLADVTREFADPRLRT
ncbi:MAG: ABC transporter permease [Gemmatimonadaceae bacterium]